MLLGKRKFKGKFALFFALCFLLCLYPLNCQIGKADIYAEGRAECVIEAASGRILYESHGDLRLPIASTTKIVTAATVLRLCDHLKERIAIPTDAVGIEGSSIYLKSGEEYTLEELLYGLMLRSGNDAAVALALHCCGSVSDFLSKMNETAQMAGALDSHFSNPHGLPCKNHYSTARDMCYIAAYAMKNSTFRTIVSTQYYAPRNWQNKNRLLSTYEGGSGIKTGYTKEAGRCLVAAAEREGMTLISTVLNCSPMFERSAELLDGAYSTYKLCSLLTAGDVFTVEGGKKAVQGYVKENFSYPLAEGEKERLEYVVKPFICEKDGKVVGQIEIYLAKRLLFFGNLYKL